MSEPVSPLLSTASCCVPNVTEKKEVGKMVKPGACSVVEWVPPREPGGVVGKETSRPETPSTRQAVSNSSLRAGVRVRHPELSLQWGEGFSLPKLEDLSERVVESSKAQPRCLYLKFCCCASKVSSARKPHASCCSRGQRFFRLQVHTSFHCQLQFLFRKNRHGGGIRSSGGLKKENNLRDSRPLRGAGVLQSRAGWEQPALCSVTLRRHFCFSGPSFIQLKIGSWTCFV